MLKYSVSFNVFVILIILNSGECDSVKFEGTIAGNREISECVNGYNSSAIFPDPEEYITTSQFVRRMGYPAEEHVVMTEDGYILTLHRIPGPAGALPVFLKHPLSGSSFEWVTVGKEKALAFILANAGYDVWMGNSRGTTYSRCHTKYKTSSFEFWDFSWHEIGIYDLPAMITYVSKITGQRIVFIGHSMGTTEFFVMASEKPDIASKVKVMIALGPTVYLHHGTSGIEALIPTLTTLLKYYVKFTGTGEIFSSNPVFKAINKYICSLTMELRQLCATIILSNIGFNPQQFNYTLFPRIFSHAPAGLSIKSFIHYSQVYTSQRFQKFDYGVEKNLKLYNSITPPKYNLSRITVPIGLFWSDSDKYINPIDVMRLYMELPNAIPHYRIKDPNFNHADYLFAMNAPKYVYEKILSIIKNYK